MMQSSTRNDITKFIGDATGIENFYGDKDITTRLAKSINQLILSDEQIQYNLTNKNMTEEQSKIAAVEDYKYITKKNDNISYEQMVNELTSNYANVLKYYEYYQFKRGIFRCSSVSYDNVTDRVNVIKSEVYFELDVNNDSRYYDYRRRI